MAAVQGDGSGDDAEEEPESVASAKHTEAAMQSTKASQGKPRKELAAKGSGKHAHATKQRPAQLGKRLR